MNKSILACGALAVVIALPLTASAQQARYSKEQLIEYAIAQQACGEDRAVVDAAYADETSNRYRVTCGAPTGIVPLVGAVGLGGAGAAAAVGLGLLAVVAGGSTSDTQ